MAPSHLNQQVLVLTQEVNALVCLLLWGWEQSEVEGSFCGPGWPGPPDRFLGFRCWGRGMQHAGAPALSRHSCCSHRLTAGLQSFPPSSLSPETPIFEVSSISQAEEPNLRSVTGASYVEVNSHCLSPRQT